jgi:hypothetical protein
MSSGEHWIGVAPANMTHLGRANKSETKDLDLDLQEHSIKEQQVVDAVVVWRGCGKGRI